jgi:hypothetical protein
MAESVVDPEERGLPPEGLWVSPDGEPVPVIEHLLALKEAPETFGLSVRDVERSGLIELRELAVKIIKEGWTRFRFLSGVWNFEVNSIRNKKDLIEEILVTPQAWPQERIVISQASPKRDYQGSVSQFYDRSMFRHYELGHLSRWRFS